MTKRYWFVTGGWRWTIATTTDGRWVVLGTGPRGKGHAPTKTFATSDDAIAAIRDQRTDSDWDQLASDSPLLSEVPDSLAWWNTA